MAFDGIFIHHLTKEIASQIVGGRVDKIHQPEKDELSLNIRGINGNVTLFISVDSSIPYFSLTSQKKTNPMTPPMFCMLMRKHIAGGKILAFKQHGFERIVSLEVESKDDFGETEIKTLYIEIMGKHSNVILTKQDQTIIDCIKRIPPDLSRVRTLLPGLKYWMIPNDKQSPEIDMDAFTEAMIMLKSDNPQLKLFKAIYTILEGFSPFSAKYIIGQTELDANLPLMLLDDSASKQLYYQLIELISIKSPKGYVVTEALKGPIAMYFVDTHMSYQTLEVFETLSEAVERFYSRTNRALKVHQHLNDVKKRIQTILERNETKLAKLTVELAEAETAEDYKVKGDLLYANIYHMEKGMSRIELDNFYDPDGGKIEILLDVRLDPAQNAQVYFKKYAKLKTAQKTLEIQIKETHEMIQYLENVMTHMNDIESPQEMSEILQELAEEGLIKKKYKKNKKQKTTSTFKTYRSTDGFDIMVGKNNIQNDILTLKTASNKDIWLHTKIIPGSHVIIRTKGEDVPESTLFEAAKIAAYHSKARLSDNVPVDYTLVKYVTKPSGAKPGMVIYTHNKTIYVTPLFEDIEPLRIVD